MTTQDTTSSIPAKRGSLALQMGPHKRVSLSNPLVSHGHHFGRMVFALCNYPSLLTNDSYPGLLDRLKDGSDEEILHVGELGWIGMILKLKRIFAVVKCQSVGINGTSSLYAHYVYNHDDPWSGLLRSLLASMQEPKATQSGNARLHGMNSVTMASIAYITTQDSETFYHSLLDLLEDPEESKEVDELLTWWNCQVFPTSSAAKRPISANSSLIQDTTKTNGPQTSYKPPCCLFIDFIYLSICKVPFRRSSYLTDGTAQSCLLHHGTKSSPHPKMSGLGIFQHLEREWGTCNEELCSCTFTVSQAGIAATYLKVDAKGVLVEGWSNASRNCNHIPKVDAKGVLVEGTRTSSACTRQPQSAELNTALIHSALLDHWQLWSNTVQPYKSLSDPVISLEIVQKVKAVEGYMPPPG
ncbi:hypothetical protein F4604DRAFT_1680348 [Suillus subluteus]|nr:hypothetical protein F4604DRAFT_1680348 [Suillus subluteus]